MFDYIIGKINGWLASGAATWDDAVSQIQNALDTATGALASHQSIYDEAFAAGHGAEWDQINTRLTDKLDQLKTLASAINALLPGETFTGLNALPALPPVIAGLSVGAALLLLGSLYVVAREASDFFLKVTGVLPPTAPGGIESLIKFGVVAAAIVLLLPKILERK